jgi:asparagine synthase (glutamine-hydrolysing)
VPLGDESAIATLPLAQLARRHVTVALSGTGGDDLFAGYYRHRAPRVAGVVRRLPSSVVDRAAARAADRGAEAASARSLVRSYAARLARIAQGSATGPEHYLELVGASTSTATAGALPWLGDLAGARNAVGRRLGLAGASLDDIQDFELRTYLPGCILVKEDRATMAYGLEGRVPLLDDEVAALASRTPASQRAGLRGGKLLLREVARRRLPGRRGRKRGFAVPLRALFDGPWRTEAIDWLTSGPSDLVDGPRAAGLVGRPDVPSLELWALCALRAWELRLAAARTQGQAAAGRR